MNDPLADLFDKPRRAESNLPRLIDFAKRNNLTVGSTTGGRHNVGSKHYSGNAIDIRGSGRFDNATVARLKQAAASEGFLLRDERVRPPRQKVWGGPHVHIEVAGNFQPQKVVPDPLADLFDSPQGESEPVQPISQPTGRGAGMARARQSPPRIVRGVRPSASVGVDTGLSTGRPKLSIADLKRAEESIPRLNLADVKQREDRVRSQVQAEQRAGLEALRTNPTSAQARLYDPRFDVEPEVGKRIDQEMQDDKIRALLEANRPKIDALKLKIRDMAGDSHGGRLVQSVQSALANSGVQAGNLIQAVTAGQRGSGLTEEMRIAQQALAELDEEDPNKGWLAAAERALPGAAVELAKMTTLSRIPVAGRATLPGLGALSTADQGVGPATRGAVEGEIFHRGFGAMAPLSRAAKFGVGTAVPAAIAIAEGEDPKKAILSNTAFGAMALATPKPIERRQTLPPLQRRLREGELQNAASSQNQAPVIGRGQSRLQTGIAEAPSAREVRRVAQGEPQASASVETRVVADVAAQPELKPTRAEFQHKDFGRVVEAESQSGVSRGQVRVVDEQGAEHVIKRVNLTGAGNIRAIPIKSEQQSTKPTAEPESIRPTESTPSTLEPSVSEAAQPVKAETTASMPLLRREGVKPEIDPNDYVNFKKLNISEQEKANLAETVKQVVSEGRVSKERVTFQDIQNEARAIDPELVRNLKPPKRGETIDPVVRFAARERLNTLNGESVRLQKELDTKRASASSDPVEITALESRLAQAEGDAKSMLDVLIPTRSQDGRNLAYHRMLAQQSFDADYWLSRARRVAERSGEDVTGKSYLAKEKTIRKTLVSGQEAETRLATLEKQVAELRAKLEKADSGQAPEGKPTRAFRQKAETLQARLDTAAEQARLRLKQRAESGGVKGSQAGASTIPLDLGDYAIIGASKLARKGISSAVWTEEMLAEFGETIRPYIRSLYSQSYKLYQDESKALQEAARVRTVTRGQPERYTQREISNLVSQADQARKEVQQNRAQLARTFANLEKTSVLETISALRKAGLLTGVKTHLRNVGSTAAFQGFDEVSRIPAAITDLVVSGVTRRRSISGANPVAVARSSYEAATKGVKEAVQILKHGATEQDLAKLEIKREVNSGWRIIDAYTNGVFRVLGAEDKVFRTFALKRSLEDQARVIALNESRQGKITRGEIGTRTKELSQNPTAEMAAQATVDSEVATFNNKGVISGAIQRGKTHLGQGGRFAVDLLIPFTQTPSNIFTRLIEATPFGAAKAVGRGTLAALNKNFTIEEQRAFSQTIGRSVTGSSLIALGYFLASKGLATGTRDDEFGKNERDKAAGRSPMSIRIGDAWHQVGAFSPLGNLVAIGATLHREEHQELKDESQRPMKIAAIAGKTLMEQPMLKGVSSLTETLSQPVRSGSSLLSNVAGSFVPTAVSDLGAVMDNRRREARGIGQAIQSRIPLLRRRLPESVDVFGRPLEARKSAAIDPTLSSTAKDQTDPLMRELVRLDASIPKSQRKPGEDETQYRARIIAEGNAMEQAARQVLNSRGFATMSDEEKREAFKDGFEYAKRFVKTGGVRQRQRREPRRRPIRIQLTR